MARARRIPHSVDYMVIRENVDKRGGSETMYMFATRLNELMENKGIYQFQMSIDTDIPTGSISKYRNGRNEPSATNLNKIAEYLEVSTDYLLGNTENPTTDENLLSVCNFTGLSQKALENILEIKASNERLSASARKGRKLIHLGDTELSSVTLFVDFDMQIANLIVVPIYTSCLQVFPFMLTTQSVDCMI